MPELDRHRASALELKSASAVTVGDEPLIVDVVPPTDPNIHYIVESVTFLATLTGKRPSTQGAPPVSGLFLCPPNTPIETLAEAQAGWNPNARGFGLPLNDPFLDSAIVGGLGAPFALQLTLDTGFKRTIPKGYFIRAIIVAQAGDVAPGPGVGSTGVLSVLMTRERDLC